MLLLDKLSQPQHVCRIQCGSLCWSSFALLLAVLQENFQEKCSKNGSACARHKFGNNANNTSHQQHGGWEVASKGNELGGCEGIVNAVQYPTVLLKALQVPFQGSVLEGAARGRV